MAHPDEMVSADTGNSLIEVGVILAGPLDAVDREAADRAVEVLRDRLSKELPNFEWQFFTVRRDEWTSSDQVEPTDLAQHAREERDVAGWDFAFVLTAADLISYYRPFSLAVVCSSLDVAVVSTARIDPRAADPLTSDDQRSHLIEKRVLRLMLHALGHWLGLSHDDERTNVMFDINSIAELTEGMTFTAEQLEVMRRAMADIADQRLEERAEFRRASLPKFYLLAAWENRGEVMDAVVRARPWEFPTRLSRLTTAAVSTVVVLMMTAETWDMAMSQTPLRVLCLLAFAIVATTGYVAVQQQLFLRRNGRRITEQIVTTNVSAAAIVATGLIVMFLVTSGLALVAGLLLFPTEVVNGWAASVETPIATRHYLMLATTVGSLGILIGALGASFEQQNYFRHVVVVDEEV